MPIIIRSGSENKTLSPREFKNEEELQLILRDRTDLLRDDEDELSLEFVAREVALLEAGRLDLLCVDGSGMPICVEVKLGTNDEVRRKVVAQAIDYLSVLTTLKWSNYKNEVARHQAPEGSAYVHALHEVWGVMSHLQDTTVRRGKQ